MSRGYNFLAFTWKNNRLMVDGKWSGAEIVPDSKWAGMWRIEYPKGTRSDMVNRARAKDGAFKMVSTALERARGRLREAR